MPNTHSTLTGLFADIADAIREKDGSTGAKVADAFPAAIRAIPTGGGGTGDEDAIIEGTISEYTNSRVSVIRSSAFYQMLTLTSVAFPSCIRIFPNAFCICTNLLNASFPVCTSIGTGAFSGCTKLLNVSFPVCTIISPDAFNGCSQIQNVLFPVCSSIGTAAFRNCSALISAYFPSCTLISASAFSGCTKLTEINVGITSKVGSYAFYSCYRLGAILLTSCSRIDKSAFARCYNLLSIYLQSTAVCILEENAFNSTPIAGYTTSTSGIVGSIFVPASLVEAYKSATNWVTYADRITAAPDGI